MFGAPYHQRMVGIRCAGYKEDVVVVVGMWYGVEVEYDSTVVVMLRR